jgi:O-acetyl-ADP-ribose deacetylase (regulator of RNase III)
MFEFKQGNLLESQTEALVNTVNCVGVMGKGIALQFKQAFPENFKQYKKACDTGKVKPGDMFTVATGSLLNPRYIINFPTKRHWKGQSRLEDIESGLKALIAELKHLQISSVAIPPLGCGNGGLNWAVVKPMIIKALENVPEVSAVIFEPSHALRVDNMRVETKTPGMTRVRALIIQLFEHYGLPGYRLTRLETQKLAYLLQESGEEMKLNYVKHQYGPYADNLNHLLQRLDGHFIRGFGDRDTNSQIYVLAEGSEAAQACIEQHPDAKERLERVSALIEGFETPYGMEMLTTLHWIARRENPQASLSVDDAIAGVQAWSDRKRNLFKPEHLCIAWQRLNKQGWLVS